MEQFFYTETMTVMNADADFRSLLKPSHHVHSRLVQK